MKHVIVTVSSNAALYELCEPIGHDSVISHTFKYDTVILQFHKLYHVTGKDHTTCIPQLDYQLTGIDDAVKIIILA